MLPPVSGVHLRWRRLLALLVYTASLHPSLRLRIPRTQASTALCVFVTGMDSEAPLSRRPHHDQDSGPAKPTTAAQGDEEAGEEEIGMLAQSMIGLRRFSEHVGFALPDPGSPGVEGLRLTVSPSPKPGPTPGGNGSDRIKASASTASDSGDDGDARPASPGFMGMAIGSFFGATKEAAGANGGEPAQTATADDASADEDDVDDEDDEDQEHEDSVPSLESAGAAVVAVADGVKQLLLGEGSEQQARRASTHWRMRCDAMPEAHGGDMSRGLVSDAVSTHVQ